MQNAVGWSPHRRARSVTWGTVSVLVVAAVVQVDFWPLTAYRLFSTIRTDERTVTRLIAVVDGEDRSVTPRGPLISTTTRFVASLPEADDAARATMLATWLPHLGLDPADVTSLRLESVHQVLDPETLLWSDGTTEVSWQEDL
ncbi:hypothetical protein [Antribacter gilvus]|uniref:hypothetical protein n=1 Tax=Antribacter gilvus TaxID=2304675 RepID=UPI000F798103|nr:hypothetical protein [Antribacter gilvus]